MDEINKLLKDGAYDEFSMIHHLLKALTYKYSVNINIHDIAGIRKIDSKMDEIFSQYDYHNNGFCNFVKKSKTNFILCTESKNRLCNTGCSAKTPFYGKCYMGIKELYYPMLHHGQPIAMLCVGQFTDDRSRSVQFVRTKAIKYGLDVDECVQKYLKTVKNRDEVPINELHDNVQVVCKLISLVYQNKILAEAANTPFSNAVQSSASYYQNKLILSSAMEFIKLNYAHPISLKLISKYCNCNATYLSYLFKKDTGTTITEYIHKCKIDHAKHLLDTSDLTIAEISYELGFNDSSYFFQIIQKDAGYLSDAL